MKELIVASNPARKRRRKGASAKQRAAARRNIKKAQAALRRGGGGAPRRRRRRGTYRARARRRRSGGARRIMRRRNPIGGRSLKSLLSPRGLLDRQIMPALMGGAGAVANDVAFGLLPLPDMLKTGPTRFAGKALTAIVLGYVAGMVVGRRLGDQLGAGALTVVGYNVVKEVVTKVAPDFASKNLGMYLEPGLGYAGAGWSPKWGGINNTMSGMSRLRALLPRTSSGGGPGVPGEGVAIPRQLVQPSPYAAQAGASYADELDGN